MGSNHTEEDLSFLVNLAASGPYQAVIDRTYELPEIAAAHRMVDTGRKRGDIVLRVSPVNDLNA
ncbi:zinc-binding dehydrogenase [Pseudarthrobacter cellobiosi]|uniref:zinc-binding dehydrogenase n=1 Tax=Pseudarthrobacter cellobiosi TaxID=2953654 RepID=UPI0027E38C25|nr:zinc-binding dehydrogenase [Pseudarthrobacter sp. HLT1-5]